MLRKNFFSCLQDTEDFSPKTAIAAFIMVSAAIIAIAVVSGGLSVGVMVAAFAANVFVSLLTGIMAKSIGDAIEPFFTCSQSSSK